MSRPDFDAMLVDDAEQLFSAVAARTKTKRDETYKMFETGVEIAVSLIQGQTKTIGMALGARMT